MNLPSLPQNHKYYDFEEYPDLIPYLFEQKIGIEVSFFSEEKLEIIILFIGFFSKEEYGNRKEIVNKDFKIFSEISKDNILLENGDEKIRISNEDYREEYSFMFHRCYKIEDIVNNNLCHYLSDIFHHEKRGIKAEMFTKLIKDSNCQTNFYIIAIKNNVDADNLNVVKACFKKIMSSDYNHKEKIFLDLFKKCIDDNFTDLIDYFFRKIHFFEKSSEIFIYCCEKSNMHGIKLFLKNDFFHVSGLNFCVMNGNFEACKLLIINYNPYKIEDFEDSHNFCRKTRSVCLCGLSPLMVSIEYDQQEIFDFLLEYSNIDHCDEVFSQAKNSKNGYYLTKISTF